MFIDSNIFRNRSIYKNLGRKNKVKTYLMFDIIYFTNW